MANTATPKTALPIYVWGAFQVTPVEVVIDTVDTDLTVYTPTSGNMAAIVGISYAEATAHNLKFTDGSDLQVVYELGANSGLAQGIGDELLFVGQPSNAIKIQSSAAISGPMIVYVIEAKRLQPTVTVRGY